MKAVETFPGPRSERRQHTEARILGAARELFSKTGYDRTTIRAVAAAADVDPALVMHYFGSKEDLFAAAIHDELEETLVGPQDELGERLLAKLEDKLQKEPAAQLAMLRSMLTNEQAADGVRRAIARECAQMVGTAMGGEEAMLRAELLSATMTGVLVGRYLLQLDRLRDADPDEITEILRPCFQALVDGDVEPKRTKRVTRAKAAREAGQKTRPAREAGRKARARSR